MKTMNCKELGGACDLEFRANTFDEIKEMSKQHGMAMFAQQDQAHLDAMQKMKASMKSPEDFVKWEQQKRKEFDALPDD